MNAYRQGTGVGQGAPETALTLAHLPIAVLATVLLAGLYAAAFRLGLTSPAISLALILALVGTVALGTGQWRLSSTAGTRLALAYLALVCLIGGVAAAPPDAFAEPMLWSLAAMTAVAGAIGAVESWLTEKIGATSPFSRRLAREANGLLVLAAALLLWRSGQVGAWIVAAGAVHYLVLAMSLLRPALRADGPGARRTLMGFVALLALAAALTPWATPPWAAILSAIALALVVVRAGAELRTMRKKLT